MHSRDLTQIVATAWQHQQPLTIGMAVPTRRSPNSAKPGDYRNSDAGHDLEQRRYPYLWSYASPVIG